MFTGIVEEVGTIERQSLLLEGVEAYIAAPICTPQLKVGDSIAINGVCSTVSRMDERGFHVQWMAETLKKTSLNLLSEKEKVNLELSVTPTTRLGGHLVTGHVDETGTIRLLKLENGFGSIEIAYSSQFYPYLIPKGSITLDGISLTLVEVTPSWFRCELIPHTLAHTTLQFKKDGDCIRIEYDLIGKYLFHFYQSSPAIHSTTDHQIK